MPRNKLSDLNNLLFEQLERVMDSDEKELSAEIQRGKAVVDIGLAIVANARLELDAVRYIGEGLVEGAKMPTMLAGDVSGAE